jgi:hypothetical protein
MGGVSGAPHPKAEAELEPVGRDAGVVYVARCDRRSWAAMVLGVTRSWGLSSWAFLKRSRRGPAAPYASLKRRRPAGQHRDHLGVSSIQPWNATVAGSCWKWWNPFYHPTEQAIAGRPWRPENEGVSPRRSTGRLVGRLRCTQHCEQCPVALAGSLCILP